MWIGDQNLEGASEADLNLLHENGIDGFHIAVQSMPNMGGAPTQFNANLQWAKDFANAHPQFRCTVGVNLNNRVSWWTPGIEWFDDSGWSTIVLPNIATVANAVASSALIGVSLDGEDYSGTDNGWRALKQAVGQPMYDEASGTYSDAQVKVKVKARAKSIADTITAITGPVEIYQYYLKMPYSTNEAGTFGGVENVEHGTLNSFDDRVSADWIDGITSNSQVKFYHLDASYYKPDRKGGFNTVDEAYVFDREMYDADPRLRKSNSFHCAFNWITEGPRSRGPASQFPCSANNSCSDRMFPVDAVTEQLQKARQYTEGNKFSLYDQGYIAPPTVYGPYFPAIKSAST